jgi:diphthine-ammonia ligase
VSGAASRAQAAAEGSRRAVVLWTGGKDSALALHEAEAAGLSVSALVTFAPPRARFRAHPLSVQRAQAKSLGLPHRVVRLRAPYRAGYRRAFERLRTEGIRTVVTGDIDRIGNAESWIRSIAEPLGLRVRMPLWRRPRRELWARLHSLGFDVVVSYVDTARLPAAWVRRRLDPRSVRRLASSLQARGGDLAGENGEYHTWVLDAPRFRERLDVRRCAIAQGRNARWLRPGRLGRRPKPTRRRAASTRRPRRG